MTYDLFATLCLFAFVASVTPGPNNLMLLASGVNFGFRRTIPHIAGIASGFTVLLLLVGFGLGEVFQLEPRLFIALKIAGGLYLAYLAWRIANSGPVSDGKLGSKPMTWLQAALFQAVNPKAWVMAIGAMTAYTVSSQYVLSVFVIAGTFAVVNIPSVGIWVLFGTSLRRWLNQPAVLRAVNWTMAGLLILSLWPIVRM